MGGTLRLCKYLDSHHTFRLRILASFGDSCLQPLLLWGLPNSDFLFLSFLLLLLIGILL